MSIQVTEEQSRAIEEATATPPSVVDPRSHKRYLISSDVFERLKALLHDEEYALADTYRAQIDSALKAGWDDPAMAAYNDAGNRIRKGAKP